MRSPAIIALLLALLLPCSLRAEGLLIVANAQVPVNSITPGELASIYLIRKNTWADGLPVVPVNRDAASNLRERFSEKVLEHSPRELTDYWNRIRFEGRIPPLVQMSDQAVIGFVRNVPGAIGYVGADQTPPVGVKVLARIP